MGKKEKILNIKIDIPIINSKIIIPDVISISNDKPILYKANYIIDKG